MTSDDTTGSSTIEPGTTGEASRATNEPPIPEPESVRVTGADERPVIEVTVAAPVATVWAHLRDPELIPVGTAGRILDWTRRSSSSTSSTPRPTTSGT